MGEEELRGAIEFQAQDYIPIPIEEAVLDFQVVHRYTGNDGIPKQQVLLVAAQKEMVQRFLDAARRAGLKVAGIDVNAFALIRALALPGMFVDQGAGPGDSLCVVNVSSSASTLVVSLNDVPKFTRNISFAYDAFARVLEERQGIPSEDAAVLLERVGLAGPLGPDVDTFSDVTIQEVQSSLAPVADSLADEIRRSLDYYQSQDYSANIEHLALTGRGALMRNLDAYLSESLGLDVELGNPLLKLVENRSGVPDQVLGAMVAFRAKP